MLVSSDAPPRGEYTLTRSHPELERLISNAVCDEDFAAALLADPITAISHAGYSTRLSGTERRVLSSVQGAQSVAEFAAELHQRLHPSSLHLTSTCSDSA